MNPIKVSDEWLKENKCNYSIKYKLLQSGEILTEVKEISAPDPSQKHLPQTARLVFLSTFTTGIFLILFSILFLRTSITLFQLSFNKNDSLSLFSLTVILTMFLIVLGDSSLMPVYNGDAYAIRMLKAKVLFYEGFGADYFHNPNLGYSHLDYPLLIPILINGVYSILGSADDSYGKIIYPFIYLLFIGLILSAFYSSLCILTKNEGLPLAIINILTLTIFYSVPNKNIKCFFTYISVLPMHAVVYFLTRPP